MYWAVQLLYIGYFPKSVLMQMLSVYEEFRMFTFYGGSKLYSTLGYTQVLAC